MWGGRPLIFCVYFRALLHSFFISFRFFPTQHTPQNLCTLPVVSGPADSGFFIGEALLYARPRHRLHGVESELVIFSGKDSSFRGRTASLFIWHSAILYRISMAYCWYIPKHKLKIPTIFHTVTLKWMEGVFANIAETLSCWQVHPNDSFKFKLILKIIVYFLVLINTF